jgi:hypothetical protein
MAALWANSRQSPIGDDLFHEIGKPAVNIAMISEIHDCESRKCGILM